MTGKEINDKVGAMHFRFLDDEESYDTLLELLNDYSDRYDQYGKAVTAALEDGLQNMERYIRLENALSPRSIIIEKQEHFQGKDSRDTEGAFHVVFVMDDESRHVIHFNRKQDQLLYMLILLCSQKSGLLSDFFKYETRTLTPVQEAVIQLVKLVYPHMKEKPVIQMVKDLSPDNSFTSILQNMKEPITECLEGQQLSDDQYWFMPSAINMKRKRLYRMHLPQTKIIFPEEFKPVITAFPDAAESLKDNGLDLSHIGKDMNNDFAKYKELADQGDAEGLFYVGAYYGTGDVVAQDYEKSREYLEKADRLGYLDATYELGRYYMHGFGVKEDTKKALSYLERAAKKGHSDAAAVAAQMYERGTYGVKINQKKAFNLYLIAAEQGNEEAIWYVLDGYLEGNGTKVDYEKALEWLEVAEELEYYNVLVLAGAFFFNQGDEDSLDIALELFAKGVEQGNPLAFYFMGRMALKRYHGKRSVEEEALEWFVDGADYGDKFCIETVKKYYPETYKEHEEDWKEVVSKRDLLISQVQKMGEEEDQILFITLIDAYRERWQESYLKEICKQLRIHKSPDSKGSLWKPERRIIVKKTTRGKSCYQIVLVTADGVELPIKTFNTNALVLFLLTIICSYKSGYSTEMAKDNDCIPLIGQLVNYVFGEQFSDKYLNIYIEEYMSSGMENSKYYRPYSKLAKDAVSKSLGMKDDPICFLFDNDMIVGRKKLRRMNIEPQNIELPQELVDLAIKMPDALDVLKLSENQPDTSILNE